MSTDSQPHLEWNNCNPGDVASVVKQTRRRQQLRAYGQAAAVATLLIAVAGIGMYAMGLTRGPDHIACRRVHDLAPQAMAGTLNAEERKEVESHLKHCRRCRDYFSANYPKYNLPAQSASEPCPHHDSRIVAFSRWQPVLGSAALWTMAPTRTTPFSGIDAGDHTIESRQ